MASYQTQPLQFHGKVNTLHFNFIFVFYTTIFNDLTPFFIIIFFFVELRQEFFVETLTISLEFVTEVRVL
jgi:hypothetical protein